MAKVQSRFFSVGGRILELLLELAGHCDKVHSGRLRTIDAIRHQLGIPGFPLIREAQALMGALD